MHFFQSVGGLTSLSPCDVPPDAAKGGGEPAAAKSFSLKKNAMTDSHAEEILNLPKGGPYTEEEVQKVSPESP